MATINARLKNIELSRALFDFKPEFGNENHVRIIETLDKVSNLYNEIDDSKSEKKIKRLTAEVKSLESTLLYLLENKLF